MSLGISNFSIRIEGKSLNEFPTHHQPMKSLPYSGRATTHPSSTLVFEDHKIESKKLFFYLRKMGWDSEFPCSSPELKLWIQWLQLFTRFWSYIPIQKCLTREEIFYGNLVQGPDFAAYVKKCRFYTMQHNIALDSSPEQEDYILEGWEGYDSIPPESNFIHWEEVIDDFPWCMIEPAFVADKVLTPGDMQSTLGQYLPKKLSFSGSTDFLSFIKPSKVFDPSLATTSKTRLVRELLVDPGSISEGWVGTRSRIQVMPAGGRDTTIATPSTLVKIKYSNEIFKQLCDAHPNSAMAPHRTQERRINRVRRRGKVFLHWDFKKLGLVCHRSWFMALANLIQETYHIDMSWFDFDELVVNDGGKSYQTKRGFALGWMNEGVTMVIIHWLTSFFRSCSSDWRSKFDFVVFNDDVEIALLNDANVEEMDVLKDLLLDYFRSIDVPCSIKKIFFSRESIFLEDYYNPIEKFNFSKHSIAMRLYAKAAMNSLPVARKGYIAAASQIFVDKDILRELISDTKMEFDPDERDWHFSAGGFYYSYEDGLSTLSKSLLELSLASEFAECRPAEISRKFKQDFSWSKAAKAQDQMQFRARERHEYELPREEYRSSFVTGLAPEYASVAAALLPEDSLFQEMSDRRAHVRLIHDPG
jgi:hypothetical protein